MTDPSPAAGASAFADIVRGHQSNVWWYLRLLGADPSLADDLTQETFLAAWRAGMQHNEPATFGSYLRRAARSVYIRACRTSRRQPLAIAEIDAADRAWTRMHGDEPRRATGEIDPAIRQLRECMGQLAPRARAAIRLQYEHQKSGEQAATELGVSPGNLRVLVHRARQALRRCLENWTARTEGDR